MSPILSTQVILGGSPSCCAPGCSLTGLLTPAATQPHCSALLCCFLSLKHQDNNSSLTRFPDSVSFQSCCLLALQAVHPRLGWGVHRCQGWQCHHGPVCVSPSPAAPAWSSPAAWDQQWTHGGVGEEQVVPSGVCVHITPTPQEHFSGSAQSHQRDISSKDGPGWSSRHSFPRLSMLKCLIRA